MSSFEDLIKKFEELKDALSKREKLEQAKKGDPEKVYDREIRDASKSIDNGFLETEEGKRKVDRCAIVSFRRTEPEMCLLAGMAILAEKDNPNMPIQYLKFKAAVAERMVYFAKTYLDEVQSAKESGLDVEELFKM